MMSFQIETARVKQFSSNVMHLMQQKTSRLSAFVRHESIQSKESFYDRIGEVEATERVGRHTDTVYSDTPHSRRKVISRDYVHADMVDDVDKLRIIQNPESEYAIAAAKAFGRRTDRVIIAAALGISYAGEDGNVQVSHDNSVKIVAHDGTSTTGKKLNVKTLRAVKKLFNKNEVDEGMATLYFALNAENLDSLLAETEVTSSDFNSVKALVQGDVDTFMGFKFIRIELLDKTVATTTYNKDNGTVGAGTGTMPVDARRCFAWAKEGILLATAKGINARVDELPTKNYSKQVYSCMSIGATRMEEVQVVEVICLD